MMKASGFEILLVTSLSKFGGSSSILCAFLCQSFLKHLQISDGVTEWNENFWVVCIGKFVSLFYTKSFIGCRVWSILIAILEKIWPNPLAMLSLFDISSLFTLNVMLVSFFFCLVGNIYTFQFSPEWSSVFDVFIQQVFVVVLFGSFNQVINFVSLIFVFLVVFGCFQLAEFSL